MMKFFRKYNKHLLAVFMTLLVMVWVGGQALEAWLLPTPGAEVIARAFGRDIQGYDRAVAAEETRILDAVGLFHWRTLGDKELQPLDWYLLRREAVDMGITIPPEEVDRFLFQRLGMTNEQLASIRQNQARGVSIDQIRLAVAGYLTVQEAFRTAAASVVRVTEARVKNLARDTLEKVRVEFVVLPATSFRDNNETLDEAELAAHFETYKNVAPRSEGGLGFGYQIPTQVRVEYIEADLAKIKPTISVSEDEIGMYYDENKAEFVKPAPPAPPPLLTPNVTPSITPTPTTPTPTTRPRGSRRRRATTQPAVAPTPAVNPSATPTSSPEPDGASQVAAPTTQNTGTVVKAEIVFAQDGEAEPPATAPAAAAVPSTTVTPAAATPPATPAITVAPQPGLTVTSTPLTVPAAPAASPIPTIEYLPLYEVREQIREKLRTPKAAEKAEAFMKGVLSDLAGFWDGAARDDEGFRIAPSAEVTEPGYLQNVLNKRQRRGWRVAEACSVQTGQLFDATPGGARLVQTLGLTNAADLRVQVGQFYNLVLLVKGVGTFPAEDSTEDTTRFIAVNQTCPILLKRSNDGNLYLFRVTEVVPAHAPENLEAIRLRVDSDFRTAKSFALVEQEAQRIAEIARREGIDAAREALSEDVQARVQVVRPDPFPRLRQRSVSFAGTSRFLETPSQVDRIFGTQESMREFIDACFALGQARSDEPTDHRVTVAPRPGQRQVVVVKWIETLGVRRDDYKTQRDRLIPQLAFMDQQEIRKKWFGPEQIQKRVGFELVGVADDDETVEP